MRTIHPKIIEISNSKSKGADLSNLKITDEDILTLCNNKHLVNISLENTLITDLAFQYLATLPQLMHLWLDNTAITGEGFVHFFQHKKLQSIGANHTLLNNETLKTIAQIPNLKFLQLDGTRITLEGILAIAENKKIEIISKEQFSVEELALFKQKQRDLSKKKKVISLPQEEIEAAKSLLVSFFKAIGEWERWACVNYEKEGEYTQKIQAIYQTFATERHHQESRYHFSCNDGGFYANHTLIDVEIMSPNKLYLYTEDDSLQYRFLLLRTKDQTFKIDSCQYKSGTWQKVSL